LFTLFGIVHEAMNCHAMERHGFETFVRIVHCIGASVVIRLGHGYTASAATRAWFK